MSFFPVSAWWVWSVSIRAGSHLSLSANVYYEEPADVSLDWTRVSSFRYLSSEFNWCLPEVFPNVFCQICLKGSLDVFQDQPNVFLPVSVWWVDQCLSEQVLNCVFLPMSYYENPADVFPDWALRLLANVFLVSSIDVFHEVSPNVFCQICLQEPLDVFQDQPTVFLPVSV